MSKHSVLIQWSEEDQAFIAISPELEGLSAFGSTYEEAARELSIAQDLYLETLKEDNEAIPEPDTLPSFSGQVRLRLPKSLHASLSNQAKKEGVSLNTHMVHLLSERHSFDLIGNKIESLKGLLVEKPSTSIHKTKAEFENWGEAEVNIQRSFYGPH